MKRLLVTILLVFGLTGYSVAIKVGDQPIIPGGLSVGFFTGVSNIGGIAANVAYLAENFLQTLSDRVSLTPVDITLTTGRPNGDDGTLAGTDEATIDSVGKWHTYGAFLQICPYSEDTSNWTGSGPWTQSISLTNLSTYTVSTNLNGATVTITAGTATIDAPASATYGLPDQFIVSGAGTVTITTDTADPKAQLTETAYKFPYLVNTTAGSLASPLNYTTATEGYKYPFSTMPRAYAVLNGPDAQGQLEIEWTPMFDYDQASGDLNLISWSDSIYRLWATSGKLRLADGTTILSLDAINYQANTTYNIKAIWGTHPTEGANKMQLIVTDGTTTWESSIVDFDGSFNPGDDLSLAWENPEWQTFESITIDDEAEFENFTFWETAYGTDWTVAYGADWTLPYNTEIP